MGFNSAFKGLTKITCFCAVWGKRTIWSVDLKTKLKRNEGICVFRWNTVLVQTGTVLRIVSGVWVYSFETARPSKVMALFAWNAGNWWPSDGVLCRSKLGSSAAPQWQAQDLLWIDDCFCAVSANIKIQTKIGKSLAPATLRCAKDQMIRRQYNKH